MGKMVIGPRGQSKKQHVPPGTRPESAPSLEFDTTVKQMMAEHEELLKRLTQLEKKEPAAALPAVVEKSVETVKEVSVITKDTRARQYAKAIKTQLEMSRHKLAIVSDVQEIQGRQIEDLQKLCFKLQSKLAELEKREAAIEAIIPEENQEVKEAKVPTLLYMGLGLSLALSVLSLILK